MMIRVKDLSTGRVMEFTDSDDFRAGMREEFDKSVHYMIDALADAKERGEYSPFEMFLNIDVIWG